MRWPYVSANMPGLYGLQFLLMIFCAPYSYYGAWHLLLSSTNRVQLFVMLCLSGAMTKPVPWLQIANFIRDRV
ncbi:hypothetical protein QL093DRAFT_2200784 [Fusarium oxysporum]|nr:hypothetical protein QL093DRAFT_2200784 [Fusarium oxysporum]